MKGQARKAPVVEGGGEIAPGRAVLDAFRVTLPAARPGEPTFEGPLDLLLHLVKEHQVDVLDIPIARITESYLATIEAMRELDIDIAGEFLHMAAQLMLMKSKLLLPRTEVAEDAQQDEGAGVDPRAELVRRLLEYQKYKAAAEELAPAGPARPRRLRPPRPAPVPRAAGGTGRARGRLGLQAHRGARPRAREGRARAQQGGGPRSALDHRRDLPGRRGAALARAGLLRGADSSGPEGARYARSGIIATFLALLEMAKLKLIRIHQASSDEAGPGTGDRGRGHRDARRGSPGRHRGLSMTDEIKPSAGAEEPAATDAVATLETRSRPGEPCEPSEMVRQQPNPVSDAELRAMQAAEDAKGDPALDEVEAASIEVQEGEKDEPFDKLAARAKRLSPERVRAVVEGLLFLAEKPLTPEEVRAASGIELPRVKKAFDELSGKHREGVSGIVLHEVAGGWQLRSSPDVAESRAPVPQGEAQRLTRAALETLAIIAYRQPVTRPEIEEIRGVDSGAVVKALLERKLVKILGKKEEPGRPILYGTTREFLEFFALKDLASLPDAARVPRALRGAPRHRREGGSPGRGAAAGGARGGAHRSLAARGARGREGGGRGGARRAGARHRGCGRKDPRGAGGAGAPASRGRRAGRGCSCPATGAEAVVRLAFRCFPCL